MRLEPQVLGTLLKLATLFLASVYLFELLMVFFFSFSFPFMQGDVVGGVNVKRIITSLPGIRFIKAKWHFSK